MSTRPHHDSEQPDLRDVVADAVNELIGNTSFRGDQPPEPVSTEQVEIACQRTSRGAATLNPVLNGGDLSACIVTVSQGGANYPWAFVLCRLPGNARWQPVASVGGHRKAPDEPFVGKLRAPKSFIAIGSLNEIPDGGRIRIELPDGETYEDTVVDGCAIALAPLTMRVGQDSPITIHYVNADGTERGIETV